MKKTDYSQDIQEIKEEIYKIRGKLRAIPTDYISIHEARKRDYIVRTKYYGKITDTKIKKDFKEEVETRTKDSFDSICNNILNYRFVMLGEVYTGNILDVFYKTLEQYEYKQIVLDMYGKQ